MREITKRLRLPALRLSAFAGCSAHSLTSLWLPWGKDMSDLGNFSVFWPVSVHDEKLNFYVPYKLTLPFLHSYLEFLQGRGLDWGVRNRVYKRINSYPFAFFSVYFVCFLAFFFSSLF